MSSQTELAKALASSSLTISRIAYESNMTEAAIRKLIKKPSLCGGDRAEIDRLILIASRRS